MTGAIDDLYETDFFRWTKAQAAELRRMRRDRVNTGLDLARLAEEVEKLGKSERDACRSRLRRIIAHCLKLRHSPATAPRGRWRATIIEARGILGDKLSPTSKRDLRQSLPDLYASGRAWAAAELADYGEESAAEAFPAACPYSLDELLDPDWFPDNS